MAEERLNEISKRVLASYVKQASRNREALGFRQGRISGWENPRDEAKSRMLYKKSQKRHKYIDKAVDRLSEDEKAMADINEAIKGWKHAGRDITAMRKQQSELAAPYYTHDLKKDGSQSKMHDARKYHQSVEAAKAHIEYIKKLNPSMKDRKIAGIYDAKTGQEITEETMDPRRELLEAILEERPHDAKTALDAILREKITVLVEEYRPLLAQSLFEDDEEDEDEENSEDSSAEEQDVLDLEDLTDEELEELVDLYTDEEDEESEGSKNKSRG